MTNQKLSRNPRRTLITVLGVGLAAGTMLVGCEEDEPPAPVAKKAPPPPVTPPPPPPVDPTTSLSDLMTQYDIDPRVNLTENMAPDNDEERIAILLFFDAFARGNSSRLGDMLSEPDKLQLERLVESGAFAATTDKVELIDLQTGMSPMGDPVVLGIFMVGTDFQPTLWSYEVTGDPVQGQVTFDAEPTPPDLMNRLSGANLIQAWYAILAGELARAGEMDEVVEIPSQDFTESEDSGSSGAGGPGGGGGGAPGKRKQPTKKVNPNPGFGPGGPGGN
ncbi:MAG: hypothetical protein MK085_09220 [Phycisphaerales bacterium]|nr:hypothetical protein [Phycisphaerales bacterium]